MELLANEIPGNIKIQTIKKVDNWIQVTLYLLETVKELILSYEKNTWYWIDISWDLDVIKELYINDQDDLFITKDGSVIKKETMEDFESSSKILNEENYIPWEYIPYNKKSFIEINVNNIQDILLPLWIKVQWYINLDDYKQIVIYISPIIDDLILLKTSLLEIIKNRSEEIDYWNGGFISSSWNFTKKQSLKNGVSIIAKEVMNIFTDREKDTILISKNNLSAWIFDVEWWTSDMYWEDIKIWNDIPILSYSLFNVQLEPVLMYMFLTWTIWDYYNNEDEYWYFKVIKSVGEVSITSNNTNLFELIPWEVFYDYKNHIFYNVKLNTKYEVTEKYFYFMSKLIESEWRRLSYEEISNIEDISDWTFKWNLLKLLRRKNIIWEKVDFIDWKNKWYKLKYYN